MTDTQTNALTIAVFLAIYSGSIALAQGLQIGAAPELLSLDSWVPAIFYTYLYFLVVRQDHDIDPEDRFMTLRSSWSTALFAAALVIVPFGELFRRLTGS